jgi:uncharacterized protein (TIGR03435 family)
MSLTSASLVTAGSPMIAFVNVFSQITGKTVVDRTGLTGLFEADLQWLVIDRIEHPTES